MVAPIPSCHGRWHVAACGRGTSRLRVPRFAEPSLDRYCSASSTDGGRSVDERGSVHHRSIEIGNQCIVGDHDHLRRGSFQKFSRMRSIPRVFPTPSCHTTSRRVMGPRRSEQASEHSFSFCPGVRGCTRYCSTRWRIQCTLPDNEHRSPLVL